MKIKISKRRFLISLLIFLYIFEYTLYGQPISGLKYIVQVLCIFIFFCKNRKYILVLPKDPIVLLLIVTFGIIPVGQAIVNRNFAVAIYTVVMWIFIISTYYCGRMFDTKDKQQNFVKVFAIIGTVVVLVCVVLNYTNLFNFSAIISNFGTELNIINDIKKRERSGFGFMHVNSLGGICVAIIVSLVIVECHNGKAKILRNIAITFIVLVMLNTGSRASIYGTAVFFLVLGFEKTYFRSKKIFKYCLKALVAIFIIYAAVAIYNTLQNNYQFVSNLTSGRIDGWIYDFVQMKKDSTLLFGYGLYNPTRFFSQPFAKSMIVDNWFVYMITNLGFIGFSGCVLLILFIAIRLIIFCLHGDDLDQKVTALFFANLFHAMAEKAFITPADPISFFMMVMVFSVLYRERN